LRLGESYQNASCNRTARYSLAKAQRREGWKHECFRKGVKTFNGQYCRNIAVDSYHHAKLFRNKMKEEPMYVYTKGCYEKEKMLNLLST